MTGTLRRRRFPVGSGWALLAVLAIAASVLYRPPSAPPLYDGLGFPDEPYRWVVAPQGEPNAAKAATPATVPLTFVGDRSAAATGLSDEISPQVAVLAPEGTFFTEATQPAGSTVQVVVAPAAIPGTAPPWGDVVSNLYQPTLEPAGVRPTAGARLLVNLRAVRATKNEVVLGLWDGAAWTQIGAERVGTEIYAGYVPALQPFALVELPPGATPTATIAPADRAAGGLAPPPGLGPVSPDGGGPGSGLRIALGGGAAALLLGAGLVLARRLSRAAGRTGRPVDPAP